MVRQPKSSRLLKRALTSQPKDEDGGYVGSRFIDFLMESRPHGEVGAKVRNQKWNNSVGYFDFTGPMKHGGMGVHELRLFSMAGWILSDYGLRRRTVRGRAPAGRAIPSHHLRCRREGDLHL